MMEDINSINPIIDTPVLTHNQIIFIWFIVVTIITIASYLLWKKYAPQKKDLPIIKKEEIIDYRKIALDKLAIAHNNINDYKEFYLKITAIIKEYLSGVHKINYTDLTTTETLRHKNMTPKERDKLLLFLQIVDFSKFSSQNLENDNIEKAYRLAKKIIE